MPAFMEETIVARIPRSLYQAAIQIAAQRSITVLEAYQVIYHEHLAQLQAAGKKEPLPKPKWLGAQAALYDQRWGGGWRCPVCHRRKRTPHAIGLHMLNDEAQCYKQWIKRR